MEKRLYRSRRERMIAGVCGGLAEYFDADVTLVRVLAVVLAVFNGAGVLVYVLLWILVPEEPVEGGAVMSDTTPSPAPEQPTPTPGEPAADAAAAPTYSPPTYTPPAEPAASPVPPAAAPAAPTYTPPAYAAPEPVTGRDRARGPRSGGVMAGVILILLGGIFLASQFVPGLGLDRLWPLILIAIGIGIIVRRR